MNEKSVQQYLRARLQRRLESDTEEDFRPKLDRLAACVSDLLAPLSAAERNIAERVLADEFHEVLTRFCFAINEYAHRDLVQSALNRRNVADLVEIGFSSFDQVAALFSAYGVFSE